MLYEVITQRVLEPGLQRGALYARGRVITSYSIHYTKLYDALGALAALLGFAWHWAAAAAVLAAGLALHSAQLAGFLRWLRKPSREALPAGRGAWEEAFASLHRITSYNVCYTKLLRMSSAE